MNVKYLLAGAAIALLATGAQAATNLIVNGSFETGDTTGWTLSGNYGYSSVEYGAGFAPDGDYDYSNGAVGSPGYLSQTFSDIAGVLYTVSGAAYGDGGGNFNLDVDGASFGSGSDTGGAFVRYGGSFVGTGSDTLTITNQDDPGFNKFDAFRVSSGAVPEPAAWALMLLGFGGVGAGLRRRARAVFA